MMKTRTWLSAATVGLAILAGCATAPQTTTVAETAAARPELSTVTRLVSESGLAETLKGAGPYTLFAPTDDAFKAVPAKTMAALAADKSYLQAVLGYHVIPGHIGSVDVKNGPTKTLQGANVALSKSGTFVTIEDAVVTQADVPATNGVVHIIDRVLIPPSR